jgi:hypothetical protein
MHAAAEVASSLSSMFVTRQHHSQAQHRQARSQQARPEGAMHLHESMMMMMILWVLHCMDF